MTKEEQVDYITHHMMNLFKHDTIKFKDFYYVSSLYPEYLVIQKIKNDNTLTVIDQWVVFLNNQGTFVNYDKFRESLNLDMLQNSVEDIHSIL